MKCIHCEKSPAQHGVTLLRQNVKGVICIWACEACNRLPIDNALAQDIAELQCGIEPQKTYITGVSQ